MPFYAIHLRGFLDTPPVLCYHPFEAMYMNADLLSSAALNAGADNIARISSARIMIDASFRKYCAQNACGCYGRCWVCPPDCGEIGDLERRIRAYPCALLYQTVGTLEDSFDADGMRRAKRRHLRVSQALQTFLLQSAGADFLHLSAGGCGVCETCAKITNEPCRHPERALLSLEACGIDVYNTVKDTPLKYANGQNTVAYFGAVLYHEA